MRALCVIEVAPKLLTYGLSTRFSLVRSIFLHGITLPGGDRQCSRKPLHSSTPRGGLSVRMEGGLAELIGNRQQAVEEFADPSPPAAVIPAAADPR